MSGINRKEILTSLKQIEEETQDERLPELREKVKTWKEEGALASELTNALMGLYKVHRNKTIFALLYLLNYKRLTGIAWRTIANQEDLSDVMQEVFLRIHKYAVNFRAEEAPNAFEKWSNSIAKNTSLLHVGEKQKKQRLNALFLELAKNQGIDALPIGGREKDPAKAVIKKEEKHLAKTLFQYANRHLSDADKNILFLTDVQEWSYREISRALNIPYNQVGTYLARARARRSRLMKKGIREMKEDKRNHTPDSAW